MTLNFHAPRGHASLRGGGADRVGIAETFGQRQLQDGAWKENTMAMKCYNNMNELYIYM